MLVFKRFISGILLILAVSYSLDMHGLTHIFENENPEESNHCELCIINHQKEQTYFVLLSAPADFVFIPHTYFAENKNSVISVFGSIQSIYLTGQLFNRPPPYTA